MEAAFTAISIGSKLGQASAQRDVGREQQKSYELQAQQAELKGRSEAIAYKQQGADALRNLNETLAAIIARAGAGGVDPTSGSAATVQMFSIAEGVNEAQIAKDNAALALGEGYTQGGIYRSAGSTARRSADVNAAASVGEAAYMAGQLFS
tara:strand:+ start:40 stop:492 length:453 start_codon:yes stop_codon:yes gene_type:complete